MKQIKYFIPSALLMFIIFMFSSQTGDESAGLSLKITLWIQKILPFITSQDLLHFMIRKAAHMSEYAILTFTYIYGYSHYQISHKKICLFSIMSTFLYACTDEMHQLLVGGRAGQLTDVFIDTSGGILALLIFFIFMLYRKKHS